MVACRVGEAFEVWLNCQCGNARAGAVPARIYVVELEATETRRDGFRVFQMMRTPYIQTRNRLPFGGAVDTGMLVEHECNDVAAMLVEHSDAAAEATFSFVKYNSELLGGDRFLVYDRDDSVGADVLVHSIATAPARSVGPEDTEVDWDTGMLPRASKARESQPQPAETSCLQPPSTEEAENDVF